MAGKGHPLQTSISDFHFRLPFYDQWAPPAIAIVRMRSPSRQLTGCTGPRSYRSIMSWLSVLLIVLALSCVDCTLERDRLIREYFARDFPYRLILCFLAAVHGICISLSTLKRTARRLNLRRRGQYTSLWRVSRCLLVCFTLLGNIELSQREEIPALPGRVYDTRKV